MEAYIRMGLFATPGEIIRSAHDPSREALQHMNDLSGLIYFSSTAFESKLSTRCRQNK